ncbi:AI-2E family transporter [Alicyclobacillus cycloheptanicus]|uniref:PurR-regulated permease PerM n=1 Tax=Alicyclobacillus cycloheptanicus TaxID=1457 RepID=A0ABT9XJP8_9BACL|nr:AI-2E family transporter [Alicyclobacillus cycloheptanicus]MDQ0190515.1 putative PurR-regulated permease PerM [Alicyclobacillus cycloheptanicus]WDM00723.1 AI-2E family transporter [Alicyclobacillus cycloheptanicus]
MDVSGKTLRIVLTVFAILLSIYLLGQLRGFIHDIWVVLKALVIPFLIALVITYLLEPLVNLLTARKVPRGIAIIVIYCAFVLLVIVAVLNAIPMVNRQFAQLGEHLPALIAQANHWLDELNQRKQYLPEAVRKGLESALTQSEQHVTEYAASVLSMVNSTVNALFIIVTVPFIAFYMLKDAKAIGRGMVRLAPLRYREEVAAVLSAVDQTFGSYVRGQLLVMLAVGVLTYAGLLVVHMPYALLLALFLAIADLIPYIGPIIGAAPALLLALAISPQMALKVLIVNVIVQQCEGNLLSPQIMGRTLKLHPLSIVAALLIGGEVGGVLGLMVAVPVLAVCKVVWQTVRELRGGDEA